MKTKTAPKSATKKTLATPPPEGGAPSAAASPETSAETKTTPASSSAPAQPWLETVMIPLDRLEASPTNPRKHFPAEQAAELEASMLAHGFSLSTLLVRKIFETLRVEQTGAMWWLVRAGFPEDVLGTYESEEAAKDAMKARDHRFEVVAGERRFRAALAVGVADAPCIIRQLSDSEVLEIQLVENVNRKDLSPLEEAMAFARLLTLRDAEGKAMHTTKTLAARTGKSVKHIERMRLVAGLEGEAREWVEDGKLPVRTAMLIATVPDAKLRKKAEKEILHPQHEEGPLSFQRAEYVVAALRVDLRGANFDLADAELVPVVVVDGVREQGGACTDCPFRLGNMAEAVDLPAAQHNLCLLPSCFALKLDREHEGWMRKNTEEGERTALSRKDCLNLYRHGDQRVYNSGLVDLAECPDSEDLKAGEQTKDTWKKLVRGAKFEIVVARDRLGRTHELVKRELAVASAVANGHKIFKKGALEVEPETMEDQIETLENTLEAAAEGMVEMTEAQKDEARLKLEKTRADLFKVQRKEAIDRDVRVGVRVETGAAIAGKAGVKPPAGFWAFLCVGSSDFYLEDGFAEVVIRRGWGDSYGVDSAVEGMTETQAFGFYVEALYHAMGGDQAKQLEEIFSIDRKVIEKTVRERVKAHYEKQDAEFALVDSMVWSAPPLEAEKFEWNSSNVCEKPITCTIALPKKAKATVVVSVAKGKKGWYFATVLDLGKKDSQDGLLGSSGLPSQAGTAYSSHLLALKVGLLEMKQELKGEKAPLVEEHLDALIAWCGKLSPEVDTDGGKKGGKR